MQSSIVVRAFANAALIVGLAIALGGLSATAGVETALLTEDFTGVLTWTTSHSSVTIQDSEYLRIGTGGGYNDYAEKAVSFDLTTQDLVVVTRMKLVSGGLNYRLPYQRIYFEDGATLRTTYLPSAPSQYYEWLFGTGPSDWTGTTDLPVPGTGWWTTATADYWAVLKVVLTSTGGELYVKPDDAARSWYSDDFTWVADAAWSHTSVQKIRFDQPWDSVNLIDYITVTGISHNSPPDADAGEDVSVECTSSSGAWVTLDGTGSTDPDGDALGYEWSAAGITFDDASSSTPTATFPLGTTTVTLTVSDEEGEIDTDTVVVEVVDTTPPTISCSSDTETLWPPNHKMVPVKVEFEAWDACGCVTITAAVSSSEPIDGLGDGDTSPDWANLHVDPAEGEVTLDLRAERSGFGAGRTYTITITAADCSGLESSANCEVCVPKSRGS